MHLHPKPNVFPSHLNFCWVVSLIHIKLTKLVLLQNSISLKMAPVYLVWVMKVRWYSKSGRPEKDLGRRKALLLVYFNHLQWSVSYLGSMPM